MGQSEEDQSEESNDRLGYARDIANRYRKNPQSATYRGTGRKKRRQSFLAPGQRTSREEPISVSEALSELIEQQGWTHRLDAERVFTDWARIVGPETAAHSEVVAFRDAVLHVQASSTAWAKELKLLSPRIVARLNELLGDGSVLRIDVRGPQAPSWKKGPYSVKGRGPRDTYG